MVRGVSSISIKYRYFFLFTPTFQCLTIRYQHLIQKLIWLTLLANTGRTVHLYAVQVRVPRTFRLCHKHCQDTVFAKLRPN